jgi:PAS domain S-box-containing protein
MAPATTETPPPSSPAVLVVDDHVENLHAAEAVLGPLAEERGFRVVLADSAEAALRHALTEGDRLAVVLLDVMMPGTDGPETARLIRQRRQTAHVPVIYVTALDADRHRLAAAYRSGAVDYITKPADPDLLRAKVAAFVELHRQRDDAHAQLRRRLAEEARAASDRAAAEADEARTESAAARARLVAVLDSLPDAVVTFDDEWRFAYVNPAAAAYLQVAGVNPASVVGQVVWVAAPGALGTRFEDALRRAARERAVVAFEEQVPTLGRWFENRVVPGADGTVTIFSRDVTPRVAAEAALRESEARLAGIVGSAMDAIITTDEERRVVVFNAAAERMFGVAAAEAVGGSLDRFIPPRFRDAHGRHMRAFGDTGASTRSMRGAHSPGPLPALRADGTEFPVDATISQTVVGARRLFTVVLRDVTERVAAERERERLLGEARDARAAAEHANASKSRFLATMSHELRTPLNAIAGHVQLVDMGIYGPVSGEQREALARVARAQRHLLSLINDVLNYAKLESGRVEYDLRPTRPGDVIAAMAPLVEPQAAEKALALDVRAGDGDAPPVEVWADRDKLGQVLLNLLSNAVKFTPRGGRVGVQVAARADDPRLAELRVWDSGVGIAADRLDTIFEPFVQVNASLTRTSDGTGLGLAISRDLARGMGGDLTATSAEGAGSTFTVTLRRVLPGDDDRRGDHDRRDHGERRTAGAPA